MAGVSLCAVLHLGMEIKSIPRPTFPRKGTRTDVVTIPVTDAIHKTLRAVARSRGIPLTQWARAVLLRAAAEARQDSQSLAP
jgi:hypothetical protein